MRIERSRLETFFEFCCVDLSFVTLRRRTRQDIEVMGNGYWEVLRDGGGEIVQLVYLPGFTMRLLPLELELVDVDVNLKISEIAFDTMKVRRRFRRYVQVFEQQVVYFKEFGDRGCCRARLAGSSLDRRARDGRRERWPRDRGPALQAAQRALGVRNATMDRQPALGARDAPGRGGELLVFREQERAAARAARLRGRLSAQSVPRIESYIENHIKGSATSTKILVLEAEPAGARTSITPAG